MQLEDSVKEKKKKQKEEKKARRARKKKEKADEEAAEKEVYKHYPWHLYGYPYGIAPVAQAYHQPCPYTHNHPLPTPPPGYQTASRANAPALEKDEKKAKDKESSVWHYVEPGQAPQYPHGWTDTSGTTHFNWAGRTREQVIEDDRKMASGSGAWDKHEMAPKNAQPTDMFWVQKANGESNLRNYATIESSLDGKWAKDPIHGSLYFRQDSSGDDFGSESSDSD